MLIVLHRTPGAKRQESRPEFVDIAVDGDVTS